jgi:tetratricopeptide (TPR) repeat protein
MRNSTTTILLFLAILLSLQAFGQRKNKNKKEEKSLTLTEQQRYDQADLFIKAVNERELGNLAKSQEMFSAAIEMNPEDPAAFYENARVLQVMGRNDEALAMSEQAVVLDPENKWYKVLYADLSKANGKYDEYVATYEELLAEDPNDLNFLNELAFAYFFTGEYQKSIEIYQRIEEKVGINEALSSQKVQLYNRIGLKDSAVIEYERLIRFYPDEARYYALLAEYCSKNDMNDKAIWAYEKIVEINPDDPYVHISLADFYKKEGNEEKSFEELKLGLSNPKLDLSTKINLLYTYYSGDLNDKKRKQALELSEILKQTHPDDPMGETFYASMLFENKEYELSRQLFNGIIENQAGNYAIWEQLLFCDLYLEDYKSLAEDAENAIDYFPSYPLPYFFAGIGNFQLKDFVKAQAFLDSGKEFVVNNNALLEQFYSSLGDTYNELGKYPASYAAYDKALSINPENTVVLNNYAYYLSLRSEQLEKAEKMAKKSVEMDPYNANNLDTYAWVLYKLGKYQDALNWIKKAYSNSEQPSGVVLEHYGDILYKLGQDQEALNYWNLAKEQSDYSDLLDKKIKDKKLYE